MSQDNGILLTQKDAIGMQGKMAPSLSVETCHQSGVYWPEKKEKCLLVCLQNILKLKWTFIDIQYSSCSTGDMFLPVTVGYSSAVSIILIISS